MIRPKGVEAARARNADGLHSTPCHPQMQSMQYSTSIARSRLSHFASRIAPLLFALTCPTLMRAQQGDTTVARELAPGVSYRQFTERRIPIAVLERRAGRS